MVAQRMLGHVRVEEREDSLRWVSFLDVQKRNDGAGTGNAGYLIQSASSMNLMRIRHLMASVQRENERHRDDGDDDDDDEHDNQAWSTKPKTVGALVTQFLSGFLATAGSNTGSEGNLLRYEQILPLQRGPCDYLVTQVAYPSNTVNSCDC
ncbi:uncharacterized protein BT62DRAFT_1005544 [Guyanagaster necrorhizus]|uniref:Uncharacterized protein n=1 Tax=Guyanagaster necrorhizus TaxID=856835 RepID=A0A9P7VRT2_9AGAR|nr:uncharacterized protein BT62DRAFT_1005544 [Guyanagaster necrorhizus MCA 3950]KAG7446248.1 hypothetical protein BT62DRAFT_1005544 [Guyanagaster necrorhizus MCA 3950]